MYQRAGWARHVPSIGTWHDHTNYHCIDVQTPILYRYTDPIAIVPDAPDGALWMWSQRKEAGGNLLLESQSRLSGIETTAGH